MVDTIIKRSSSHTMRRRALLKTKGQQRTGETIMIAETDSNHLPESDDVPPRKTNTRRRSSSPKSVLDDVRQRSYGEKEKSEKKTKARTDQIETMYSSAPNMSLNRLDRAKLMQKSHSMSSGVGRKVRHIDSNRELQMQKTMKSRFLHAKCGLYIRVDLVDNEDHSFSLAGPSMQDDEPLVLDFDDEVSMITMDTVIRDVPRLMKAPVRRGECHSRNKQTNQVLMTATMAEF